MENLYTGYESTGCPMSLLLPTKVYGFDTLCNWRQLTAGHKILIRLADKRELLLIDVTSILVHCHMSKSYASFLSRA